MCYDTECIEAPVPWCVHTSPSVFPSVLPVLPVPAQPSEAVTTCNPAQCLSSHPEMRSPAPLLLLLGILTEIIIGGAIADCSNKVPRRGL